MRVWLYRAVLAVARVCGLWVVVLFSRLIAAGYFVFNIRRLRTSVRFYRVAFPERGTAFALLCAWRQYQAFSANYAERLRLQWGKKISYDSEGFEKLSAALDAGSGGVILMSHLGSWEIAARLLRRRGIRLLLYVMADHKKQLDRLQKSELVSDGVRIVAATAGDDTQLNGIEGLTFLKEGGFVSLAGDRVVNDDARKVEVELFGRRVELPAAPYVLAMLARAPIFIFFAVRQAAGKYRIVASEPVQVKPKSRKQRDEAIQQAAQAYADRLQTVIRKHPDQWFTFDEFL